MIGSFLNVVVYRVPGGCRWSPALPLPQLSAGAGRLDNVPSSAGWPCGVAAGSAAPRFTSVSGRRIGHWPGVSLPRLVSWDRRSSALTPRGCRCVHRGHGHRSRWPSRSLVGGDSRSRRGGVARLVAPLTGQPGRLGWAAVGEWPLPSRPGAWTSCCPATAMPRDGSGDAGRAHWARRAALAASLGWCAGWLWAPGALILAGWVVTTGLAIRLIVRTPPVRSLALLLIGLGAFGSSLPERCSTPDPKG